MFIVSVWSSAAFVLWQSGVLRRLTFSLKQNKFAIQPIAENVCSLFGFIAVLQLKLTSYHQKA